MEPLYGVLDMLVLRTLLFGPLHGYAIAGAIRDTSGDALKIEFGSLVSSPQAPRAEGVDRLEVGNERAEPAGEGVSPDRRRPQAAAARNGRSGRTSSAPSRA